MEHRRVQEAPRSEHNIENGGGTAVGKSFIATMGRQIDFDITDNMDLWHLHQSAINIAESSIAGWGVYHADDINILLGTEVLYDGRRGEAWAKEIIGQPVHKLLRSLDGSEGFSVVIIAEPHTRHLRCCTCHEAWNGQELMYRSKRHKWHCLRCQPARQEFSRKFPEQRYCNPNKHERTMTGWKR